MSCARNVPGLISRELFAAIRGSAPALEPDNFRPLAIFDFHLRLSSVVILPTTARIHGRAVYNKRNKKLKVYKSGTAELPPVFSMPDTYSHSSFIVDPRVRTFPFVLSLEALPLSFPERTINSRGHWYAIDASGPPWFPSTPRARPPCVVRARG